MIAQHISTPPFDLMTLHMQHRLENYSSVTMA